MSSLAALEVVNLLTISKAVWSYELGLFTSIPHCKSTKKNTHHRRLAQGAINVGKVEKHCKNCIPKCRSKAKLHKKEGESFLKKA